MTNIADATFDELTVQPFVSGRGPKIATIVDGTGHKFVFTLGDHVLTSPFGAGTFDRNPNATRLTLELSVPSAMLSALQLLDAWVVAHCVAHKAELFPDWTDVEVASNYHSFLQYSDKYQTWRMRTKFSTVGLSACRFWNNEKQALKYEEVDTKTAGLRPWVQVSGLWWQGRQYGLTLNIVDLRVNATEAAVAPW